MGLLKIRRSISGLMARLRGADESFVHTRTPQAAVQQSGGRGDRSDRRRAHRRDGAPPRSGGTPRRRQPEVPQRYRIGRDAHTVSDTDISANALKVLRRLNEAGYQAFLVGGGVRDVLLALHPKDFDVATDATPDEVRALFRNCRLIGRRFRLAHVFFGREIIEVATFRAPHREGESPAGLTRGKVEHVGLTENGRILRDNVYGTLEDDVWRRDLSINALYYDIADGAIVDYVGGLEDIERRLIRLLGDPLVRYREDPVRLIRVVRFAAKLDFSIAPETAQPLTELGHLLADVPPARLFEEVGKLFLGGCGVAVLRQLQRYDLLRFLFPETTDSLAQDTTGVAESFLIEALRNTDERVAQGKPVTPGFLFAALLWAPVRQAVGCRGADDPMRYREVGFQVLDAACRSVVVPRRYQSDIREIWEMQPRFERRAGKRAQRLAGHPRFRAAYDFLCVRAAAGDADPALCQWWTAFQQGAPPPVTGPDEVADRPRRRRRRRPRRAAGSNRSE